MHNKIICLQENQLLQLTFLADWCLASPVTIISTFSDRVSSVQPIAISTSIGCRISIVLPCYLAMTMQWIFNRSTVFLHVESVQLIHNEVVLSKHQLLQRTSLANWSLANPVTIRSTFTDLVSSVRRIAIIANIGSRISIVLSCYLAMTIFWILDRSTVFLHVAGYNSFTIKSCSH